MTLACARTTIKYVDDQEEGEKEEDKEEESQERNVTS